MLLDLTSLLLAASLASGASIPLRDPDVLYARQDSGDPGLQDIPSTGKADNTFSNGLPDAANFPSSDATPPAVYGNRTIDLPFGRLYVRILRFDTILSAEPTRGVSLRTFLSMFPLQSLLYAPWSNPKTNSEIFLQHGNLKLFPAGQLNSPSTDHDLWQPQGQDSATQSACGIPDNAFSISKVAIHPYFLKYADLSRKLEHLAPTPK